MRPAPMGREKMTFKIEIDCDNDAFDERSGEVARILRELIDRRDDNSGKLYDLNGNAVGFWRFQP